jgi:hypothetical protein
VARDEQGKPYTVRYKAVNAMLLNQFLKSGIVPSLYIGEGCLNESDAAQREQYLKSAWVSVTSKAGCNDISPREESPGLKVAIAVGR